MTTRAEDRATVGTDPSAVPGAKTEGRAEDRIRVLRPFSLSPSGLAPSDKSLAAAAASLRSPAPGKVVRISGKMWSKFPERAQWNYP